MERSNKEGWLPEMRSIDELHPDEQAVKEKIEADRAAAQGSDGGQPDNESEKLSESETYWRDQYKELDEQARNVLRYKGIINALETNPNLVDVLQRHIAGAEGDYSTVKDDLDESILGDDEPEGKSQSQGKRSQGTTKEERIEAMKAERARREEAFQAYCTKLMEGGAQEHEVDQFVKFAMNPTDLTFDDMYSMFLGRKQKQSEGTSEKPTGEPRRGNSQLPPPSSASGEMGGDSDRPITDPSHRSQTSIAGERFVPDANNI